MRRSLHSQSAHEQGAPPGNLYVKRVEMLNTQEEEESCETEQEADAPLGNYERQLNQVRDSFDPPSPRHTYRFVKRCAAPTVLLWLTIGAFLRHTLSPLLQGSHASVAGWDRPTCVPCRQILPRVPPLAVPCLGTPPWSVSAA